MFDWYDKLGLMGSVTLKPAVSSLQSLPLRCLAVHSATPGGKLQPPATGRE